MEVPLGGAMRGPRRRRAQATAAHEREEKKERAAQHPVALSVLPFEAPAARYGSKIELAPTG